MCAQRASHEDNIQIVISLDPPPQSGANFQTQLLIRRDISLDGDRVRTYTSLAQVEEDEAAGFVDAFVTNWALVAFSQKPRPAQIKVGQADITGGGETYDVAYNLILAEDCDFWPVAIDSRIVAEQVAFAIAVDTDELTNIRKFFFFQSADADWKTSGIPAAYATLAGLERWAVIYHDEATQVQDVAWPVSRAVHDPDVRSAPWDGEIFATDDLTTPPTISEKGFLDANFVNHGLPLGTADVWVDAGVNGVGRFIHEILTADWFYVRLTEATAALKIKYSARGRKVPLDDVGRTLVRKLLEQLLAQGVAAEHFQAGQTAVQVEPISDDDRINGVIRASAQATLLGSARIFSYDIAFVRNPINLQE